MCLCLYFIAYNKYLLKSSRLWLKRLCIFRIRFVVYYLMILLHMSWNVGEAFEKSRSFCKKKIFYKRSTLNNVEEEIRQPFFVANKLRRVQVLDYFEATHPKVYVIIWMWRYMNCILLQYGLYNVCIHVMSGIVSI